MRQEREPRVSAIGRIAAMFLLLMVLRLGVAFLIRFVGVPRELDVYHLIARNLVLGNGFVAEPGGEIILYRAPLYRVFLAGIYAVFGEMTDLPVIVSQAALDAASGLLVWRIGSLLFGTAIGVGAAVLFALHPLSASYTLRLMSEPLFTLALVATLASAGWALGSGKPRRCVVAGALGAVTALVRPVAVGFVPFLAIVSGLTSRRQRRGAAREAAWLLMGFVLVLCPWTLRNYWLTGEIIPVASGGGYTLWVGSNVLSAGRDDDELDPLTQALHGAKRRAIC